MARSGGSTCARVIGDVHIQWVQHVVQLLDGEMHAMTVSNPSSNHHGSIIMAQNCDT